jgi:hypothetical protein
MPPVAPPKNRADNAEEEKRVSLPMQSELLFALEKRKKASTI